MPFNHEDRLPDSCLVPGVCAAPEPGLGPKRGLPILTSKPNKHRIDPLMKKLSLNCAVVRQPAAQPTRPSIMPIARVNTAAVAAIDANLLLFFSSGPFPPACSLLNVPPADPVSIGNSSN